MKHSKIKNLIKAGLLMVLELFLIKDCRAEESLYL